MVSLTHNKETGLKRFIGFLSVLVVALTVLVVVGGCTEQSRVRNYGGQGSINLPRGEKLVVATWKEDNLWYLTRPMRAEETPETYTFRESSSWGVWEGTILIHETK